MYADRGAVKQTVRMERGRRVKERGRGRAGKGKQDNKKIIKIIKKIIKARDYLGQFLSYRLPTVSFASLLSMMVIMHIILRYTVAPLC